MASEALVEWQTTRAKRLNELIDAHRSVGGTRRGRRYGTEQLNWALLLRLAGEFQGYCRSLHDLATELFVTSVAPLDVAVQQVLRVRMTDNRMLDRGNAHPGALGSDFARLGMTFWDDLEARAPRKARTWNERAEAMNKARNAIAHANHVELDNLRAAGFPINLKTIKMLRGSADGLTKAMDDVVAVHLRLMLGGSKPW